MNLSRRILQLMLAIIFVACSSDATDFELNSNVDQTVEKKYILIEPQAEITSTCFIFYPGGLVEPAAYVSLLQNIAEAGHRVIILKATADLAIFNINRASKIVEDFPEVEHWIIGGHSLGGVVAIKAILKDLETYSGLVLLASYPSDKDDLSDWDGAVLSISAENDLLTSASDIKNTESLLPESFYLKTFAEFPITSTENRTIYYEIAGGNHAQFGDYGPQKDDGESNITMDEQHTEIISLMKLFFKSNAWEQ